MTGYSNLDGIACSGGYDCQSKIYWAHGKGKVGRKLPFKIRLDPANGLCVAYSKSENGLVSIDCEEKTLKLCSKNCHGENLIIVFRASTAGAETKFRK